MARKQPVIPSAKSASNIAPVSKWYQKDNLASLVICALYLGVHFVPDFDGYDAMGSQWLYVILVDFIGVIYLLLAGDNYDQALRVISKTIFSRLYFAYFLLAGISVFFALNQTEGWVCFVRLIATIIAFIVLSTVLYKKTTIFGWLAQLIAVVLLIECISAFSDFLKNTAQLTMDELILSIKSVSGNKNIFAAGLIVKLPFGMYGIHKGRKWTKAFNVIIFFLGALLVFLVNARAAYLSFLIIIIAYVIFCISENRKEKDVEKLIYRLGRVVIPLIAALLVSQVEIGNLRQLEENKNQGYGTVVERLGSISAANQSNMIRLQLWGHAIDYSLKHPLMGCGYGNWKIASIPYIRTITDDLYVPIHSHNDFFENFAELGVPGGLLYLSLFIVICVYTWKTFFSRNNPEARLISFFAFLAFIGYSVDAFFNFPGERPLNQVFFALIAAISVMAYTASKPVEESQKKTLLKPVIGLTAILIMLPATYVMYQTYKSLVIQRVFMPDMDHEPLQLKWQEIFPRIPSFPNLTATAQPIDAIKGRYLSEAGKYDDALVLLNRAIAANPSIAYSEFLKASLFFKRQQWDSSKINGLKAFYARPRAKTYYQTLMAILAQVKDTANIQKAFDEYNRYRPSVFGWDLYLKAMLTAKGKGTPELAAFADSGYRKLKDDPADSILAQRKAEILAYIGATTTHTTTVAETEKNNKAQNYYNAGVAAFTKAQSTPAPANKEIYQEAARNFARAGEIITNNYVIYENAGVAYFNMGEYKKSLPFFDKVIAMGTAHDGKSEYFKGVAQYNLGNQAEGCRLMAVASKKGYAEAATVMKNNCR